MKGILNEKKRAFRLGGRAGLKWVKKELKHRLVESKDTYRKKLEERLQAHRVREMWRGLTDIMGFQKKGVGQKVEDVQSKGGKPVFQQV